MAPQLARNWLVAILASPLTVLSASAQKPAELERIVVSVQETRCPTIDTPQAHMLWRALASNYSPAVTLLPRSAQVSRDGGYAQGSVLSEDLGSLRSAESAAESNGGTRNATRGSMLSGPASVAARKRFDRREYASRVPNDEPRLLYQPVYVNWYYARLDENFIDHFIDSTFNERHDLALLTVPGGTRLTFCGREHSRPWIEGTMELTRDTLLAHIAFRYFTPEPHEDAAAEVWLDLEGFVGTSGRHLWPDRSIFYRRSSGPNVWYQEAWINMITCIWHDPEEARAGKEPELSSREKGCTSRNPR